MDIPEAKFKQVWRHLVKMNNGESPYYKNVFAVGSGSSNIAIWGREWVWTDSDEVEPVIKPINEPDWVYRQTLREAVKRGWMVKTDYSYIDDYGRKRKLFKYDFIVS